VVVNPARAVSLSPGAFDRDIWLQVQHYLRLHGVLPERQGVYPIAQREWECTLALPNFDCLFAKNLTVGAHDSDAPVAGLEAPLAVRAIACRRIRLHDEADILP
jgi:hypothetical protein